VKLFTEQNYTLIDLILLYAILELSAQIGIQPEWIRHLLTVTSFATLQHFKCQKGKLDIPEELFDLEVPDDEL